MGIPDELKFIGILHRTRNDTVISYNNFLVFDSIKFIFINLYPWYRSRLFYVPNKQDYITHKSLSYLAVVRLYDIFIFTIHGAAVSEPSVLW